MRSVKRQMVSLGWICVYSIIILAVILTSKVTYTVDKSEGNGDREEAVLVGAMGLLFGQVDEAGVFDFCSQIKEIRSDLKLLRSEAHDNGFIELGNTLQASEIACFIAPIYLIAFLIVEILLFASVAIMLISTPLSLMIKKRKDPDYLRKAEVDAAANNYLKFYRVEAFLPLFIYAGYWYPTLFANWSIKNILGSKSSYKISLYFESVNLLTFAIIMLVVYFVGSYVIKKIFD